MMPWLLSALYDLELVFMIQRLVTIKAKSALMSSTLAPLAPHVNLIMF